MNEVTADGQDARRLAGRMPALLPFRPHPFEDAPLVFGERLRGDGARKWSAGIPARLSQGFQPGDEAE